VPSFVTVTNGNTEQAQDVNQIINALSGSAGNGIPISLTALNDSVNFALAVKNADATNSRALQVLRSNNNVLIQADVNGVIVSPDGGATTAQVMTVSHTQTLTNKTLTNPVVGGAGAVAAGTLGFSGATLQVGDGTVNAGINVGAWTAFVPTLNQGSAVAATVNVAHYLKQGRRAEIFIQLTATAAGTAGQSIIVSALPAAILPLTNNTAVVTGLGYVSGAPARIGALLAFTSGQLEILVDNAGIMGVNPAVTLANGSIVTMWGSWETAS